MLQRIDKKTVFITLLEIHVFPFTQILATKHMNENIDFKSKKPDAKIFAIFKNIFSLPIHNKLQMSDINFALAELIHA